jgi:peptide/nickel transport system substrate-binding protein
MTQDQSATHDLSRLLTRRRLLQVGGAAGVGLFAAACTPGSQGSTTTQSGKSGPKSGGTAILAQAADISPSGGGLFAVIGANIPLMRTVANNLIELDATGKPQPSLATSWSFADNNTTMTLKLQDGVKFHSGRPFTASDVQYMIQQVQMPANGSNVGSIAALITDMSVVSPTEITLRLEHSASNIFDLFQQTYMLDKDTLDEAKAGKGLGATGPFKWKAWEPGDSLELVKNQHYWKPGRPYLDGVTIRVISDQQALLAALQTKQVQGTWSLSNQNAKTLAGNSAYSVAFQNPADASFILTMNVHRPPLDNKLVRQAICYAIDRGRILQQVYVDQGYVTDLNWAKNTIAYNDAQAHHYSLNLAMAKKLMAQSGVKPFSIELSINSVRTTDALVGQIVQANLQEIGITLKPRVYPVAQLAPLAVGQKLPGILINASSFNSSLPATMVLANPAIAPSINFAGYADPHYTALAQQLWTSTSDSDTSMLMSQISDLLLDAAFVTGIAITPIAYVTTSSLRGLSYNTYSYLNLDSAYLTA